MTVKYPDRDFLDYFEIHSRTDHALFNGYQVARLLHLAGKDSNVYEGQNWVRFPYEKAAPYIEKARANLREKDTQLLGIKELGPMTAADRQLLVDQVFFGPRGLGPQNHFRQETDAVRELLGRELGVHLSMAEAADFWAWRSNLRDAGWLSFHPDGVAREFEAFLRERLEEPLADVLAEVKGEP